MTAGTSAWGAVLAASQPASVANAQAKAQAQAQARIDGVSFMESVLGMV